MIVQILCLLHFCIKYIDTVLKEGVLTERRCGRNLSMSFMSMPSSSSNLFILREMNHQEEAGGQRDNQSSGSYCARTRGPRQKPNLTPLCLYVAGALAFLSGVSCGSG